MPDEIYIQVADSESPVIISVSDDAETVQITVSDTVAGGNTFPARSIRFTPASGVSTFSVPGISGQRVIGVSRAGLVKGMSVSAVVSSEYLQIAGTELGDDIIATGSVTLPTGDITQTSELFIFTIV